MSNVQPPSPSRRSAVASLSLTMLLASVGSSSANVALPTLAAKFAASFQEVQWVVLAYLLASTSLVVSVGRLGDVVGRRRLLLSGLALFVIASAGGGIAPTLPWLIVARAVQGLGAAILMALATALVSESVPPDRTGSAMGALGAMSAVGTALGPSLGGALIATLGWRAIFLVNVPLGVVAVWLAYRDVPADRTQPTVDRAGFDYVGTSLLALTLSAYALAVTIGRGHFGAVNVALLAAAAVGVLSFVIAPERAAAPLVHLALLRDPVMSRGLALNAVVSTVLMTTLVVGPFYLSQSLGLAAAQVGLLMTAGPVVAAVAGVPAGRLVDRLGSRRVSLLGLLGIATGSVVLSALPAALGIAGYLTPVVVMTAGYALFQAANSTEVMTAVATGQRGVVSGALSVSRNLGLITGASVMGALFASASETSTSAAPDPAAVAFGTRVTFAVAASLIIVAIGAAFAPPVSRARADRAARMTEATR
jgi:EmrB/QacA subfamily drug resistance transporter